MASPVRFGIVGAGRVASKRLAPALASASNAELHAVASRDLARAESFGAARAYGAYDELLRDPAVDVVVIATHNGLHRDLAIAAMEAGKHVLCEKPLAVTAVECDEMLAVARATDRILVEAFMYRFHPQILHLQQLIAEGAIGAVRTVNATFRFLLPFDEPVRLRPEWGGGALLDVGCYCVNLCRVLLGSDPDTVRAVAHFDPVHNVDISLQGLLHYAGGETGLIDCGFNSELQQGVTVNGTAGSIHLDEPFKRISDTATLQLRRGDVVEFFRFEAVDCYQLEVEDIARAVLGGGVPMLGPEEGGENARIIDRLLSAARSAV